MRYAIYDKAADGYLTKMEFEVGCSEHTQFECGLNEYITEAKLLDTPKEAADVIVRIESFKFMEKGRFVVHQFNDSLKDEYIISEAGNPTKVVNNITVDLSGAIDVKYGTMPLHWSASSLDYVVNRLNRLQDASAPSIYTAWYNTFDIYKVITIIDERECTHYQFIKVTEKGLDFAKEEEKDLVVGKDITDVTDPLNKRIEELEACNKVLRNALYDSDHGLYTHIEELEASNDGLHSKLESIKKEARHWKTMYKSASANNTFPCIAVEAQELMKDINDIARAKKLANDIIDICEATADKFEITLKKFSQLYEAINNPSDDDDAIMCAFKGVLEIFSSLEDHVRNIIDESVVWKNKAIKAEASLAGQKALNNANADTIERMRTAGADWKRRAEEAIRDYTKCNEALGEWKKKCRAKDADYEMLQNKLKACEIILESTQSSLTATIKERDKALEQKEFYKRQANSVYGMTIPCRCNGKSMFYDVTTGKKILVDKEKYDDLVKWLDTINFSYDTMTFINPKPTWLHLVSDYLKDLTT